MSGDKITELRKSLEGFTKHYKELKAVGINQDILEIYLAKKTKLSIKNIKAILEAQDEFYDKLIIETIEEAL